VTIAAANQVTANMVPGLIVSASTRWMHSHSTNRGVRNRSAVVTASITAARYERRNVMVIHCVSSPVIRDIARSSAADALSVEIPSRSSTR
jgi:hypothetical protein